MFGMKIDEAKSFFFDRERVLESLTAAEARVLSRGGSFIRTTAQRSMRSGGKKGAVSKPGEPPRSHGERLLRKNVLFSYDAGAKSVVVGPTALNWVHFQENSKKLSEPIPAILEYGGSYRVFEERWLAKNSYSTMWFRVDFRRRNKRAWLRFSDSGGRQGRGYVTDEYGERHETRLRTVRIAARPYMRPALDANKDKLMSLWKDAMGVAA